MKKAMNAKTKAFLRKLQTGGLLILMICGAAFWARGQSNAPVEILWDRTYGGEGRDRFQAMAAATDGGYLLGGISASNSSYEKSEDARGSYDFWVVRVDAQGNKLWDKSYGGRLHEQFTSMVLLRTEASCSEDGRTPMLLMISLKKLGVGVIFGLCG